MATEFCPECHQPIFNTAFGVRLPAAKLRILAYIDSHPGQDAEEIGKHFERTDRCIRSHVYQINDYLMNTGIRICGNRYTGYYVDKGRKK